MSFVQKNSRLALLMCLGAGVGSLPHLAVPGGGQFWWNPSLNGNMGGHVYEGWQNIPAGGIPWRVQVVDDAVAPGMPVLRSYPTVAVSQLPGVQSMSNAADAWSNAKIPGGTGNASAFQYSAFPGLWTDQNTAAGNVLMRDGNNSVSMWLTDAFWQSPFAGGGTALGMAVGYLCNQPVNCGPTTGELVEFDIAINARAVNGFGVPIFSHLEDNAATGLSIASAGVTVPTTSYVDLQGVMTHEFGHAAGIGHSMIDSMHFTMPGLALMHCPTMFPFAQTETANDRLITEITGAPPAVPTFATGMTSMAATTTEGLMGSSARTLEADDIAALGVAYSTGAGGAFATQLCTIKGRVMAFGGNWAQKGVHVTAVRRTDPDVTRVSRLTDDSGSYEIAGLPPGEYYLYIEGPDVTETGFQGGNGQSEWKSGYFGSTIGLPWGAPVANSSLPQYVEQGFAPAAGYDGAPIQHLMTRFWTGNVGDHPSQAQLISVGIGAGQTQVRTLSDFKVWSEIGSAESWDHLRVHADTTTIPPTGFARNWWTGSGRGETVTLAPNKKVKLSHHASVGSSPYLSTVTCWVSRGRAFTPYLNPGNTAPHVFQLLSNPSPAVFSSVPLISNGGGQYNFEYTPTAADKNQMLFFQTVELRQDTQSQWHYVPSGNVVSVFVN